MLAAVRSSTRAVLGRVKTHHPSQNYNYERITIISEYALYRDVGARSGRFVVFTDPLLGLWSLRLGPVESHAVEYLADIVK